MSLRVETNQTEATRAAKFFRAVGFYLWGCFAQGWNAAALTMKAYVLVAVGNNLNPATVPHIDWHALGYIWCVSFFAFGVVDYFAKHPLPERFPDGTNVPFPPIKPPA